MKWFELSPLLSIALNIISVVCYAQVKQWHYVTYWLAAAALTATVTFWIPRAQ